VGRFDLTGGRIPDGLSPEHAREIRFFPIIHRQRDRVDRKGQGIMTWTSERAPGCDSPSPLAQDVDQCLAGEFVGWTACDAAGEHRVR
jgi:hypothetical protein